MTSKVRILSKPEPPYTEEARKNQITGTVVLQAVFSAIGAGDGYPAGERIAERVDGEGDSGGATDQVCAGAEGRAAGVDVLSHRIQLQPLLRRSAARDFIVKMKRRFS